MRVSSWRIKSCQNFCTTKRLIRLLRFIVGIALKSCHYSQRLTLWLRVHLTTRGENPLGIILIQKWEIISIMKIVITYLLMITTYSSKVLLGNLWQYRIIHFGTSKEDKFEEYLIRPRTKDPRTTAEDLAEISSKHFEAQPR
jgi:hypothetical protein